MCRCWAGLKGKPLTTAASTADLAQQRRLGVVTEKLVLAIAEVNHPGVLTSITIAPLQSSKSRVYDRALLTQRLQFQGFSWRTDEMGKSAVDMCSA